MDANISKDVRKKVYRREGYRCALCDSTRYLQIHHVVPRGKGGPKDNIMNLVCLCSDCHAMVHGIDLRGICGPLKEDIEQYRQDAEECVIEYMADYYAEEGLLWNPWSKDPKSLIDWQNHPAHTEELPLTAAEEKAWEHLKRETDWDKPKSRTPWKEGR